MDQKEVSGRLARWLITLSAHKVTVVHYRGRVNEAPDALSRMYEETEENDDIERVEVLRRIKSPEEIKMTWYDKKIQMVTKNPEKFPDWKIENDILFFYRPDYLKDIVGDQEAWKMVVKRQ